MNQTVTITVLAVYLAAMIAVGVVFRRLNRNVDDYFKSGSRGTWWLVGMSVFMASISAHTFTGNAGAAFEAGWSVTVIYLGSALALLVQAVLLARLYRRARVITFPELIRERFGPVTRQVYAWHAVLLFLLVGGVWLWGLSIFVASVFDLRPSTATIALGGVVLLYATAGGSWGVMATDFVQGVIVLGIAAILTTLCLIEVGGPASLLRAIDQANLDEAFRPIKERGLFPRDFYSAPWTAAMVLALLIQETSMRTSVRYFAAKTERAASGAAGLAAVLLFVATAVFFIPPIVARLRFAEAVEASGLSKPAEAAFAVASLELLPPALLGVMLAAMFSVTASSMDTALNRNAAMVVRDLLLPLMRRLGRPLPDDRRQMRIGQAVTAFFGVVVVFVALRYTRLAQVGMFEVYLTLGASLALPMAIPLLLGVIIRRTPPWSAFAAIAAGLVPGVWAMLDARLAGEPWPWHRLVFAVTASGLAVFVVTRLWWPTVPANDRNRIDALFQRLHERVDLDREGIETNDAQQLRILGRFTAAAGLLTTLLLLAADDARGSWAVAALACFLGGIGGLMMLLARRRSRR